MREAGPLWEGRIVRKVKVLNYVAEEWWVGKGGHGMGKIETWQGEMNNVVTTGWQVGVGEGFWVMVGMPRHG